MIHDGADIIDIGGESTRPGAVPVREDEERRRVGPLVRELRERFPDTPISVDTTKASVAAEALEAGAEIINDVSALRIDPAMAPLVGKAGCGLVLMHSRGGVADMATYDHAVYDDVIGEVMSELGSQLLLAEEAGVDRKAVAFDPGFGFSKRSEHSIRLLQGLSRLSALDAPIVVGTSRKRFVREAISPPATDGAQGEQPSLEDRDTATSAVNVLALERGAMIFRVHNVRVNRKALDAAWKVLTTTV
jgi:dihydropteroate synthase